MAALLDLDNTTITDPAIADWWDSKNPELSAIARQWWDVMKACREDVKESLHNGYPAACLDRYPFAYVDAFSAHVNVGFYCGADLPDPSAILIGSGKRMRHVKIFPDQGLNESALAEMIQASYADMKVKLST